MKELTDRALNLAEVQGATYADIRIFRRRTQQIEVKNRVAEGLSDDESQGFGVRVVADGAWGFASSHLLTPAEVDRVTARAVTARPAMASWLIRWCSCSPAFCLVSSIVHLPLRSRYWHQLSTKTLHMHQACGESAAWTVG